jgi:2'-5' RNA ligase
MRHVIAHLIRGEAREYHQNLTKELAEKFDIFPIHERIQPHLTLKRWFDLDETGMGSLHKLLGDFASSHKQSNYNFAGFGHFGTDVIYVDVIPSKEMSEDVLELVDSLHRIEGLEFDEFDNGKDFHATVAFGALKTFDYDKVWQYLQTIEQPDFDMKFDHIAILKKPVDVWVVDRVWGMQ